MQRYFKLTIHVLLVSIPLFAFNAFASSETGAPSKGGESVAAVSGWTISNIHFQLVEESVEIGAVEFDLDGPASFVTISFDAGQEGNFVCFNTNSCHWKCDVEGVQVAQVGSLRVIAAD